MTQAIDKLWHHLRARPSALAFEEDQGQAWTFGQLHERARRYAASLVSLGVKRGDRVASVLESSAALVAVMLGHYLLGVVHVPINTRYGAVEVEHILQDSGAVAVVVDESLGARELVSSMALPPSLRFRVVRGQARTDEGELALEALMEAAPFEGEPESGDEDPALFIYTSGTTGRSKGVVLPFRAVVANIDALTTLWQWTEQDRLVLALPLFHVHGLCIGVHGTLLKGCTTELHRRFEPKKVGEAVGRGGTIFMGVPTMYVRLTRALDETPSLGPVLAGARLFTSGSAALAADVFERFEAHTGHRILERYGMSETLLTLSNPYEPQKRKPGTIGFAVPSGQVQVVDENGERCGPGQIGQIVVRGDSLMTGYWNAPQKTAQSMREGWFLTGDVARYDDEGYVVHVGRSSVDIIKSGGYKISAREIEECIALHPEVDEVAVVGMPDAEWGERIVAAVVPCGEHRERAWWAAALKDFLAQRLADYKRPRAVFVLDGLPRNALEKLQKHRIKALIDEAEATGEGA